MVEKKGKIKKYCTDDITSILCNYYHSNCNDIEFVKQMTKFTKSELAEYILDSFNRHTLSAAAIAIIPEEK